MPIDIEPLTDLLLGAAFADKRVEDAETSKIRSILAKLAGTRDLPEAVEARLRGFNPAKFSPETAAAPFRGLADDKKRRLLELIASVTDADGELDLSESDYLCAVARGLGMPPASFEDLTLQIVEEDEFEHFFDVFEED